MTNEIPEQEDRNRMGLLADTDIFSSLSSSELKIIAESSEVIHYEKGEYIFSCNDPGNALFLVEKGEVLVQKEEESGIRNVIARFVQGNSFGELDLFSEHPRKADALATMASTLLRFPSSQIDFSRFLELNPALSARILHKILVEIAGRIRSVNDLVKENSPLVQELKRQVYRDKLSGIYNQIYLTETLRDWLKRQESFSLFISKPDNFKELNDRYGHEAGDKAIRLMAKGLRSFIGEDRNIARYKGNALAVIYPGADRNEAEKHAREIQSFLAALDLGELTGGEAFSLKASLGVGLFTSQDRLVEEILEEVHELPLKARQMGGGKILFLGDSL